MKVTKIIKIIFTAFLIGLLGHLLYKYVIKDSVFWILLYLPVLFIVMCIITAIWTPIDNFSNLNGSTTKSARTYTPTKKYLRKKRKRSSILGGAFTVLSVLAGSKSRNRYANGRRRSKGITQYNRADFTKKDFWE